MKFEQLEIFQTENGKICLRQEDAMGEAYEVFVTSDMVDIVCGELKRLKEKLAQEENE